MALLMIFLSDSPHIIRQSTLGWRFFFFGPLCTLSDCAFLAQVNNFIQPPILGLSGKHLGPRHDNVTGYSHGVTQPFGFALHVSEYIFPHVRPGHDKDRSHESVSFMRLSVHLRDTCTAVRTWNGKAHRDIKRIHFLHYSPPRDKRTTRGITQKRFMIDSSWYRTLVFIDLQQLKVKARRPSISSFSRSLLGDPT